MIPVYSSAYYQTILSRTSYTILQYSANIVSMSVQNFNIISLIQAISSSV